MRAEALARGAANATCSRIRMLARLRAPRDVLELERPQSAGVELAEVRFELVERHDRSAGTAGQLIEISDVHEAADPERDRPDRDAPVAELVREREGPLRGMVNTVRSPYPASTTAF